MKGLTQAIATQAPFACQVTRCSRDGCRISMSGAPADRVLVDFDCEALRFPPGTQRCDYLFVGEEDLVSWVAPIELKSGRFKVTDAVAQLRGGAELTDALLPPTGAFRFVPILAHGRGIRRQDRRALQRSRISLRGRTTRPVTIRCDSSIRKALQNATAQ